MNESCTIPQHPHLSFLRTERMPHIWCPGCGIGTSVNCFSSALTDSELDLNKVCVVSGIGCSGRVAGYMNLDSFHTTHGRAIPFATGLKLANPELHVIVYSGDGDLIAIGGNHFIHAARRNIDLLVVCVNNFNYAMTGGQVASTTPTGAVATTSPYGNVEENFNLCRLADTCGAVYVARWTTYHVRQLAKSFKEGLAKRGFSFIEVIAPCPTLYGRRNKLGDGLEEMKFYKENSEICHGADTSTVNIDYRGKIVVGRFVDRERPAMPEASDSRLRAALGAKYVSPECTR